MFLQKCCSRFRCSGKLCCVHWYIATFVLKVHCVHGWLDLEGEGTMLLGTISQFTWHTITMFEYDAQRTGLLSVYSPHFTIEHNFCLSHYLCAVLCFVLAFLIIMWSLEYILLLVWSFLLCPVVPLAEVCSFRFTGNIVHIVNAVDLGEH
jgi:hypothetical protein